MSSKNYEESGYGLRCGYAYHLVCTNRVHILGELGALEKKPFKTHLPPHIGCTLALKQPSQR